MPTTAPMDDLLDGTPSAPRPGEDAAVAVPLRTATASALAKVQVRRFYCATRGARSRPPTVVTP
jgi:hypothetical protein